MRNQKKKELKLITTGLLFLLPVIVLFGVFLFYPIIRTFYFSFFQVFDGSDLGDFVGLQHYADLISSEDFRNSLLSTLKFILLTVPFEIIISLFLALIANAKVKGIGFFRMIFSSTLGVSVAAGAAIWMFFYHPSMGVINTVLGYFGISGQDWLTSTTWALPAVALTTIWMHIGIFFIIMLAGIQNIDHQLYESAEIDGAGYFQRLYKITLPMISPTLFFLTIIGVIQSFETFGQIDILTNGGPLNSTNVIVYSIYEEAFSYGNFGYASAQAVVLFILMVIVTYVQFKFGEKKVHYQ